MSNWILNVCKHGDSMASLQNLFQCLTTLKLCIFKQNFWYFSLCLLPLVHFLDTAEKIGCIFFIFLTFPLLCGYSTGLWLTWCSPGPLGLFLHSRLQSLDPQPQLVYREIPMSQMWHPPLTEIHYIPADPFLEAVEIPLNGGLHQVICSITGSFQFCVMCKMYGLHT